VNEIEFKATIEGADRALWLLNLCRLALWARANKPSILPRVLEDIKRDTEDLRAFRLYRSTTPLFYWGESW